MSETVEVPSKTRVSIDWSSLVKKEDWWAVWLGSLILALASTRIVTWLPKIGGWTADPTAAIKATDVPYFILLGLGLLALTSVATIPAREKVKGYLAGFPLIFLLAFLAFLLSSQATIRGWGLENVLWALVFGLLISSVVGTPKWLQSAARTELFIKIGLVVYGAEILFHVILGAGMFGLIEATIGLTAVWYLCYLLALKVGLKKSLASIMSTAVSVCGVSAAIAAGGAVKGDPKEVSYTVSLVLLVTMPLLVAMPLIATALAMPDAVAGAWIGGTIDTTPAVVAAGQLYGSKAQAVATVVKMTQNAMIGLVAFILALYWALRVERAPSERPRPIEIWYRFPKFILGFIIASAVFSFLLAPAVGDGAVRAVTSTTGGIRGWFFAMAFVSIGLNTNFKELVRFGRGRPFIVFLAATIADLVLTAISAYALFGGLFFPPPL